MENFYFIGVDVSKKKLDFCVMFEGKVVHEEETANHQSAIMSLLYHLEEDYQIDNTRMLVCAEHTGQYTFPLACACKAVECKLWLENAAEIKYSSGVQRGKNDKVDAKRIAIYASRFQDKVQYYERPTEDIERLKQLESERTLYVTDLAKYKGQLKDQKEYMPKDLYERKMKRLRALMDDLEEAIQAITDEMDEVIASCPVLFRQRELLMSIDGVGLVVATNMIITTEAFTRFDDPRKFNCYAGVAPFSYSSGRIRERSYSGITVEFSRIIKTGKGFRSDYHVGRYYKPDTIYGHQQFPLSEQYRTRSYHFIHLVRNGLYGFLQVIHQRSQTLHLAFIQVFRHIFLLVFQLSFIFG